MKEMYNKFKKAMTDLIEDNENDKTSDVEHQPTEAEVKTLNISKKYKNVLCISLDVSCSFTSKIGTHTSPIVLTLENKPWDISKTNKLEPWQDLYNWFFDTDKPAFRWKHAKGEYLLLRKNIVTWNLTIQEDE